MCVWFVRNSTGVLIITSIFSTVIASVKIENLVVPDVVQSGNSSGVILDCQYSVTEEFVVYWQFNHSKSPIYLWSPHTEPEISGHLEGRLDLTYRASTLAIYERRALRIVNLTPELSGEYTCKIIAKDGAEDQQTKTMLIFSPERDFELELHRLQKQFEIKCCARGLYPQPELTIERNGAIIPKQEQRVWRSNDSPLYDAECTALLPLASAVGSNFTSEITCRLEIPQAGYSAMKKESFNFAGEMYENSSSRWVISKLGLFFTIIVPIFINPALYFMTEDLKSDIL